jgi:hypothetical protein
MNAYVSACLHDDDYTLLLWRCLQLHLCTTKDYLEQQMLDV